MEIDGLRVRAWFVVVVAATLPLFEGRAEAQFGYGFGYGFNFNYEPPDVSYINSKSLLNASQAMEGRGQTDAYADRSNAYFNHLHDDSAYEKMNVGTRRTLEADIGRYSDGPPPSPTPPASTGRATPPSPGQATSSRPAPVIALASFFDRYQKLDWPAGAPTYGKLGTSRLAADQACLAVLNEYNLRGLAQVGTVTEARSKLLDYGRPALEYVRNNTTARIADSFHLFLLSLYESLAQAATIPKPVAPATGQPTTSSPAKP